MSTRPALTGRIAIRVHGIPVPQGSKTASIIKGRAVLRAALTPADTEGER